ncbi:flagellar hook-length control protein FliK [Sporosarcina sp. A2]|uniref:flagellar hook-length control protein FliK n=1 Tax=Sporosarcina sp. A2 TaxID=3393449 RepID=UPI003D78F699
MNVGSVQMPLQGVATLTGKSIHSAGSAGGLFGSHLAGLTKSATVVQNVPTETALGSIKDMMAELLSATDLESLTQSLAELTGNPQTTLLAGLEILGQSSSIDEWAESLQIDSKELMNEITSVLEEAGVSKEELAEVMFSNDVWTLLNVISEHAPKLSVALEGMISSGNLEVQNQATHVLALLKSVETVLPKKDLLGWQQMNLKELTDQIESFGGKVNETRAVLGNPTLGSLMGAKTEVEPSIQRTILQSMTVVTGNSQEQTSNEGKSEQSQTHLLQNTTIQPIVSRNVFSLETPDNRPTTQSEALLEKLQGLFKQTNFGQQGGTNRLLVKLYPEHLGQVRIELLQVNGIMTARILASTALGKEMLNSQLHQLRQSFTQQNIQIDRIDVTQAVQDPSRNDRSQNFNHQQFKGNDEQSEQSEHDQEEQQSFQEFLLDVEV